MLRNWCTYIQLLLCNLRGSCNDIHAGQFGSCNIKLICMCECFQLCISVGAARYREAVCNITVSPNTKLAQRALYDNRADRTGNTRHHYLSRWMRTKWMSLFCLCSSSISKCFVLLSCYWMGEEYLGHYLEVGGGILGLSYNSISEYTLRAFVC